MKKILWNCIFFMNIIPSPIFCRRIIENTRGALYNAMMRGAPIQELEKLLEKDSTLLYARDIQRRTPLHWAANYALVDVVEFILRAGANPNVQDFQGNTPLHLVARFDVNPIERKQVMSDLLRYGADIYRRNEQGYSVIDIANPFNYRNFLLKQSIIQRPSARPR